MGTGEPILEKLMTGIPNASCLTSYMNGSSDANLKLHLCFLSDNEEVLISNVGCYRRLTFFPCLAEFLLVTFC